MSIISINEFTKVILSIPYHESRTNILNVDEFTKNIYSFLRITKYIVIREFNDFFICTNLRTKKGNFCLHERHWRSRKMLLKSETMYFYLFGI